jgi:dTDP-4-amino-4,6-dideoxygalactose transaminase
MIAFSPPYIDDDVVNELIRTLKSGWITTGTVVKALEREIARISNVEHVICCNSATSGLMLALKWFGIGAGDEVIIPSFTYCATALAVYHLGAKIIMVDVNNDFTINIQKTKEAISSKTKAIIPVDVSGWPAHYDDIFSILQDPDVRKMFTPETKEQEMLNRVMILSDSAHSLGAFYNGKPAGSLADLTVFSFHAVKNVTTAEGGAICINLQYPFVSEDVYGKLKLMCLNGQTRDAFDKTQTNEWRYDIVLPGYKMNMPDICAAIGLAQIRKYQTTLLPRRKFIAERYNELFAKFTWAQLPDLQHGKTESSYHYYPLRIKGISESRRDSIIQEIFANGVSVNVHFIPLPLLSAFSNLGYQINDYPNAYDNYSREISLPVYPQLENDEIDFIVKVVEKAYNKIVGNDKIF